MFHPNFSLDILLTQLSSIIFPMTCNVPRCITSGMAVSSESLSVTASYLVQNGEYQTIIVVVAAIKHLYQSPGGLMEGKTRVTSASAEEI